MLSTAQLAHFQQVAAGALDTTCTVQRNSNLGVPNTDATWQDVSGLTDVAASRNQPQGGYQQQLAAALVDQSSWVVSLPYGSDVRRSDRLVIDGLTLTVQHLLSPQSYQTLVQVLASAKR